MIKDKDKLEVQLMIFIFIFFVPVIIFTYFGVRSLNIYMHRNEYKIGVFKLDTFDCGSKYGRDGSNCFGIGTINDSLKTKINMGRAPNIKGLSDNIADLNKDIYDVFYRDNGVQTIVNTNKETQFNSNKFLVTGILELSLLIIYLVAIYIYKKLNK